MTTAQKCKFNRKCWTRTLLVIATLAMSAGHVFASSLDGDDLDLQDGQVNESGKIEANDADSLDFDQDEKNSASAAPDAKPNTGGSVQASSSDATGEVTISDIRYIAERGGTVVVETTAPATFRTREEPGRKQVVVEIANAHLPQRLKRPYLAQDFGQSIATINAYQDPGSSTARVVVQFKTATNASVAQTGKKLFVIPIVGGPNTGDDVGEIDNVMRTSTEGGSNDIRVLPESSEKLANQTKYYGKPISIEVRDTPIRDIISIIAEQSGANIILTEEVAGTISLKLKQIPWDQILMIVMRTKNLGYVRQGNILRVASLSALQAESKLAHDVLEAQKSAETLKVKIIPISYAKSDDIVSRVTPFLTASRGKVVSDTRTSSIIITDTSDVIDRVSSLIKILDIPPLQVLIEGKVVEANESFDNSWGIDWKFTGQQVDLGGNVGISQNNLNISPGGAGGQVLGYSIKMGTFDIFGDLSAQLGLAESKKTAKVISSPRVVVMNNESATIQSTQTIQVRQTTAASATTPAATSYVGQNFDLNLTVKPQVTTEGDVLMDVSIKRAVPLGKNTDGASDSTSRSATTKVMVRNGQTAVIGGVYETNDNRGNSGVPFLKDIPVIGWLFKSQTHSNSKSELLVFLTPRIINAEKSLPKEATLQ